jgi:hypothetical protein
MLGRLVQVDLGSDMVLVRRDIAEAQLGKAAAQQGAPAISANGGPSGSGQPQPAGQPATGTTVTIERRSRRFYAKVTLDPNRPTPQVSNIAQSILSELDRARAAKITLTLDIDAEAPDGFPRDVENVIRDNAKSLEVDEFGFEGDE